MIDDPSNKFRIDLARSSEIAVDFPVAREEESGLHKKASRVPYRELVGGLVYFSNINRPGITLAASFLS